MSDDFETRCKVLKVDSDLGLVFGWGITCKRDGVDYYDTQGDCIPEAAMVEASADFMLKSRLSSDMHDTGEGAEYGDVVFGFPMTDEIAKAFGFKLAGETGLMVAVKPEPEVLAKFKSGEYTGFSIGGRRVEEEVIEA